MNIFYDDEMDDEILRANKEVYLTEISQYDRLISYYCGLYHKTLSSINEKSDDVQFYEGIMAFKEMIRSPKFLERFQIVSDEALLERIEYLHQKIEKLILKSDYLRKKTIFYKEKRVSIESQIAAIEDQIGVTSENNYQIVKRIAR